MISVRNSNEDIPLNLDLKFLELNWELYIFGEGLIFGKELNIRICVNVRAYIYIYTYIHTFEVDLTLLKNILKLKHKTIKKRSTKMLNFRLLAFFRANMAKV